MQTAKDQVRQLLDQLPDNATLNDIRYELNDSLYTLYVKQQIELGLQDAREGRVTPHSEVKRRFLNGKR
jgi:predicted transcriptional regulator